MGITIEMLRKIKEEIQNDPHGVGYSGKTNAQILALLNSNVVKQRTVEDIEASPVNRILSGMAEGPNQVELTDVVNALAIT